MLSIAKSRTQTAPERTHSVASPCVSICAMNDEGFCIGCYRTGDEIRLWQQYSDQEKYRVLQACEQRAAPSVIDRP